MGLRETQVRVGHLLATERARVAGLEQLALSAVADGEIVGPYRGIPHLRDRLNDLKNLEDFLGILAEHEAAVKALDPRLANHPVLACFT